jgi:hypothetical protein
MSRYIFDRRLPRAPLLRIYRSRGRLMWSRFRLGNHWHVYAGRLEIVVRAPWLAESVRGLYPNVYRDHA